MRLKSTAYEQGQPIPRRFACDGENISPSFSWYDTPKEAKSFVLILHDPDAPMKDGFTHWLLYNIPPNVRGLNENISKEGAPEISEQGIQGKNSQGKLGYTGPCPPSGVHRYFARFYALRQMLDLPLAAPIRRRSSAQWSMRSSKKLN